MLTLRREIMLLIMASVAAVLAAQESVEVTISELVTDSVAMVDTVGGEPEVARTVSAVTVFTDSVTRRPSVTDAINLSDYDLSDTELNIMSIITKEFPVGRPNIYDLPYSMTTRCEDWKRLGSNTGVLFAGGITALVVLQMLPEDATAWNKAEQHSVSLFDRYARHLRAGPVWDGDKAIFNCVLHPYAGGAYYMSARSQGFNVLGSFLYCTFISTCFWEYGIECFMEVPSIQDLIVTPVAGSILGEGFYLLKRHIVNNDYRLFGSSVLGNIAAFVVDPVNEVLGLFRGNPCRKRQKVVKKPRHEISSGFNALPGSNYSINFAVTF